MGLTNVTVKLTSLQDSTKAYEALFLVDTGATDSMAPSDELGSGHDLVMSLMVLHHTPEPGQILEDVACCLAPGGVVLVTDLCRHDQGWARENCGDLWLGFAPEDLTNWAESAGLAEIASIYLAQRNGFKVQVRLFGHRND